MRIAPYLLPLGAYLAFGSLAGGDGWKRYYAPLVAAQVLATGALLWTFRRHYELGPRRHIGWGAAAGVVGLGVWICLSDEAITGAVFQWLPAWLVPTARAAFDPFAEFESPLAQWAFIGLRLVGLALLVPLAEELFWRGFLLRFLVRQEFQQVPLGQFTPLSCAGVTLLFALAHPEMLAALVWGLGVNVLLYRSRSLWPCVVAHAATNLLLGVYIVTMHQWRLW